jgi:Zn-dependent M16 (insulinase) family peptidase
MVPENMWEFHAAYYHPANMGLIVSLPYDMRIDEFLDSLGGILQRVDPDGDSSETGGIGAFDWPPTTTPAPVGDTRIVSFPSESTQQPGIIAMSWPPTLDLDLQQRMLMDLFLDTFAGGVGSNLYDLFVNSETRVMDLGVNNVNGSFDRKLGHPVQLMLFGVDPSHIEVTELEAARRAIVEEIDRISGFGDGSEELAAFNRRAQGLLVESRKQLEQTMNQPPMFGFRRGPASLWEQLLADLELEDGFRKSLLFEEQLSAIDDLLASDTNFWRNAIERWQLVAASPYVVAVKPDPQVPRQKQAEKEARLAAAVAEFESTYGVDGEQAALAAYRQEFDATTAELESMAGEDVIPAFVDNPPLELDEPLDYQTVQLAAGPEMVASTFDNMTSATLGLALRLDVLPADLLTYVPLLPSLLTESGVVMDGEAIDAVEMQERLRRDVTRYDAYFSSNPLAGRNELVLRGTASGTEEMDALLRWMAASLYEPYLDPENLPRLRDLVDQQFTSARTTTQGVEESWANDPPAAWRHQDDPLYMVANSFLTQEHSFRRMGWLLREPRSEQAGSALAAFIDRLEAAGNGRDRAGLTRVLDRARLPRDPDAKDLAEQVVTTLRLALPEIPDANLGADWTYLCAQIKGDLLTPAAEVLAGLRQCLDLLLAADAARFFMISSTADRTAAMPQIEEFAARLRDEPSAFQSYPTTDRIYQRMASREDIERLPHYAGLVNESTRNGILVFRSRNAEPWEANEDKVLDSLAGKLYGGGGAHGLFMKTWAAGLAYSNGYAYIDSTGQARYYAERCPDVAKTMRFVVGVLNEAEVDERLLEYSVAQAFGQSRAAGRYEQRGEAMAGDLADGWGPDKVRAYRETILQARERPDLLDELKKRMPHAYGQVLIGYGPPLAESEGGAFFLIGPEPQFASLEEYIASAEGPQTVYRLYPRDYWIVESSR